MKFTSTAAALGLGLSLMVQSVSAAWTLNNDASSLSFISIKKGNIAEMHSFKTLSGGIDDAGAATLDIDLASVDTLIPIRDERMQKHLFETEKFATASVSVALGEGGVKAGVQSLEAKLNLHGVEKSVSAEVAVSMNGDSVQVTTTKPVLLGAKDYDMDGGVEKLREIAKLDSISLAVPVSFHLVFDKAAAK